MPYRDPERKRHWEQEHRQERVERRRLQRHCEPEANSREDQFAHASRVGESHWLFWAAIAGVVVCIGALFFFLHPPDTDAARTGRTEA